ncbi:ATP-binding protein [Chloroflexota bacterium]
MNETLRDLQKMPQPVTIREKLTRKILRAVMAQFSSLTEALLELVDNAFDEFDGITGGNHLYVDIVITKHSITVENTGGKGMGVKELQNWLNWGEAYKTDSIGEYGQGGKAAMGYLGSSWKVRTKKWDEQFLWEIKEDKWDDVSSPEKKYLAVPKKYHEKQGIGYCCFEIRKLKKLRQDKNRIVAILRNIYRKYLDEGKATITINHEELKPLSLPIYEGFKKQDIKVRSPLGFPIKGWIGRLKRDVRVKSEPRITGGMRLLRRDRLICDGEYFGHHDYRYRASLGTLIGEVDLTKVPVLPNKTGFNRDSAEWEAVQKVMYDELKPHIEELLSHKEEETVTREEKKRIQQVRDLMIEALKLLDNFELSSRLGEERGRKSPETNPAERVKSVSELDEGDNSIQKKKEPRTPSPLDAVGRLKRLGRMPEWELRVLEPDIRSVWGENEGHRCLLINKKYCLFEEREGDELYIAETAALQLARPEEGGGISLSQYINDVNMLLRAFCEVYGSI